MVIQGTRHDKRHDPETPPTTDDPKSSRSRRKPVSCDQDQRGERDAREGLFIRPSRSVYSFVQHTCGILAMALEEHLHLNRSVYMEEDIPSQNYVQPEECEGRESRSLRHQMSCEGKIDTLMYTSASPGHHPSIPPNSFSLSPPSPRPHRLHSPLQLPNLWTHHRSRPQLSRPCILTNQHHNRQLIQRELEHHSRLRRILKDTELYIPLRAIRSCLLGDPVGQSLVLGCVFSAQREGRVRHVDDGRGGGCLGDDLVVAGFVDDGGYVGFGGHFGGGWVISAHRLEV